MCVSAQARNLCVSEPVLLLLQPDGLDDDPGHPLVPLLQVQGGRRPWREHHRLPDAVDVQATVPFFWEWVGASVYLSCVGAWYRCSRKKVLQDVLIRTDTLLSPN